MTVKHPRFRKAVRRTMHDIKKYGTDNGDEPVVGKFNRKVTAKAYKNLHKHDPSGSTNYHRKKSGNFLAQAGKSVNRSKKDRNSGIGGAGKNYLTKPMIKDAHKIRKLRTHNASANSLESNRTPMGDHRTPTNYSASPGYKAQKRKKAAAQKLQTFNRGRKVKAV